MADGISAERTAGRVRPGRRRRGGSHEPAPGYYLTSARPRSHRPSTRPSPPLARALTKHTHAYTDPSSPCSARWPSPPTSRASTSSVRSLSLSLPPSPRARVADHHAPARPRSPDSLATRPPRQPRSRPARAPSSRPKPSPLSPLFTGHSTPPGLRCDEPSLTRARKQLITGWPFPPWPAGSSSSRTASPSRLSSTKAPS